MDSSGSVGQRLHDARRLRALDGELGEVVAPVDRLHAAGVFSVIQAKSFSRLLALTQMKMCSGEKR